MSLIIATAIVVVCIGWLGWAVGYYQGLKRGYLIAIEATEDVYVPEDS